MPPIDPRKSASPNEKMPAVGRDEPVPLAARRRRDVDDGLVEARAAHGSPEARVAECEHAAVRRREPVAVAARRRVHPDDRRLQHALGFAFVLRRAVRDHRAPNAVQAGRVVERGRVRGRGRGAARRVELPRRRAGHDAAHDRADAPHLLVALPVSELVAADRGARRTNRYCNGTRSSGSSASTYRSLRSRTSTLALQST